MFALQFDVSQQLALAPAITSQDAYRDLDQQAKLTVRDALYEHPALIDRFVADNPAALSEAEPPANVYRVVGITQSLEEIQDINL